MLNLIIIVAMFLIVLGAIIYLCCKDYKLFEPGKSIVENLSYIAVILTLAYAIYSYTYNIYPVFEKEEKLKKTEKSLAEVQIAFEAEQKKKESLLNTITTLETDIKDKEARNNEMLDEISKNKEAKDKLESELNTLKETLNEAEEEAVYAYLMRTMDDIVNETIRQNSSYSNEKYKLKEQTLKIANNGLNSSIYNKYEKQAFSILKEFAEQKLDDNSSDSKDIIGVITYYYDRKLK